MITKADTIELVLDPRVAKVSALYDRLANFYAEPNRLSVRSAYLSMLGDLRGQRILDAGCGAGQDARTLCLQGNEVVGVDVSTRMLALARKNLANVPTASLRRADSEHTGELAESFSVVLSSMEIFHHPDVERAISEYSRLLAPGGVLLLVTNHPVRNMLINPSLDYFDEGEYKEVWGGFGLVPKLHLSISKYNEALIQARLAITSIREIEATEDINQIQNSSIRFTGRFPSFLALKAVKPHS